ncbi:MAG TPA: DUF2238 domain-containing protein [Spirochaetota bacterium]|nr:DUF2238 domain-containing protein [Spirochaetota bacterium]
MSDTAVSNNIPAAGRNDTLPLVFLIAEFVILGGSLILAHDRLVWVLEVAPILIGLPILLFTYRRFQLTNFIYFLLVVHSAILATGGIYTYALTPFGFWMQDWFGFARNHYDRIGHFAQGFIPALLTREILIRTSPLRKGKWLSFIVIAFCLAISAMYELLEFSYAVSIRASAESFLGSQGDVWDAQWDMTFALFGAIVAVISLSWLHDRFLKKIGQRVKYDE